MSAVRRIRVTRQRNWWRVGLIVLGLCIAAVIVNEGTPELIATGAATLNGMSLLDVRQIARVEMAGPRTAIDLVTTAGGVGVLVYVVSTMAGVGLLFYGLAA